MKPFWALLKCRLRPLHWRPWWLFYSWLKVGQGGQTGCQRTEPCTARQSGQTRLPKGGHRHSLQRREPVRLSEGTTLQLGRKGFFKLILTINRPAKSICWHGDRILKWKSGGSPCYWFAQRPGSAQGGWIPPAFVWSSFFLKFSPVLLVLRVLLVSMCYVSGCTGQVGQEGEHDPEAQREWVKVQVVWYT